LLVLFVPVYPTLARQVIYQAEQFTYVFTATLHLVAIYHLAVIQRVENTLNFSKCVASRHVLGLVDIDNLVDCLSECLRLVGPCADLDQRDRFIHEVGERVAHFILADQIVRAIARLVVRLVDHHLNENLIFAKFAIHHSDQLLPRLTSRLLLVFSSKVWLE
jgi:hypothetical protein